MLLHCAYESATYPEQADLKVQHALSNTVLEPEVEQLTAAVIATGGVAPGNLEI